MSGAFRLEIHDVLSSTSDRAIALAQAGAPPWTAVLARVQTAGRGRHGRRWLGLTGNLFLSVVLDPRVASRTTWWSFAAAVATVEAIVPWLVDPGDLRLKWPNDLLLDGAKVGGILIETGGQGGVVGEWAVAGIGVNLVSAPAGAGQPAIALAARSATVPTAEALARAILRRLHSWAKDLAVSKDPGAVLSAWQGFAVATGTELTVRVGGATLQGRYLGLDADGALILQTSDGARRSVVAGEVL